MSKGILLTRGMTALVSDEDYEWLNQHKWHVVKVTNRGASGNFRLYAKRYQHNQPSQSPITMHREILGLTKGDGLEGDHINGNTLDNRRENLRIATRKQNAHNTVTKCGAAVRYKGVSKDGGRKRPYRAELKSSGQRFHLGYYTTPEEAARAYDVKASEIHGEFAKLNFRDSK